MANPKKPTPDQLPVLEALHTAAVLRTEAYRLYLSLFLKALKAGVGPSVIARYARITPQAANSTRNRLAAVPPDRDAPKDVDDVLGRLSQEKPPNYEDNGHPKEKTPPKGRVAGTSSQRR